MRFHIKLEGEVSGQQDEAGFESFVDTVMELLVDSGVDDVTIGGAAATGAMEVEFSVDAATPAAAHQYAEALIHDVFAKAQPAAVVFRSRRETTELVVA